ncbi:MAG: DNA-binding protein WhiA [Chloroflexi bacterium]|nr:DNA-binding protein WhiA [Chloroflexota bacterium]
MTTHERDLVAALRAELSGIDPARSCDRRAEMAGLGAALTTREPAVARLAVRLEREIAKDAGLDVDGGRRVRLPAAGRRAYRVVETAPVPDIAWDESPDHCRSAYLRGLFLARGSLSLSASRAHLEFVVDEARAHELARRLASIGLPAAVRARRGRGVLTWKSIETIVTFLRTVGAGGSLLELEARQVARALRGELNRVINAESANLQRAVAASARQVEAIERLDREGRLGDLPAGTRRVADARRAEPEATLSELAAELGLHRSAVQRALERIESAALHEDDAARPGRADARPGAARGRRARPSTTARERREAGGRRAQRTGMIGPYHPVGDPPAMA